MTEIFSIPREKQKEYFEGFIKKYICTIEFPKGKYGKGIFCKMPHLNFETINCLLTNHKFEGTDSNKQIKLTLFDGKQISFTLKNNDKDSSREFYQDEESGMTMIEIDDDQISNFLKIDDKFYLYDNMEVYLIDFCLESNLGCYVGLIPENEKVMDEDIENNNRIELFCFNKKKSSGGIMIYVEKDMKVIGFHFGNNNVEGKYWNSCMYLFHFIRNYYQSKKWKFIVKHKRKDGKEIVNQNNQNDQEKDNQRKQPNQNEKKNSQLNNIQKNPLKKKLSSSYSPFLSNMQFNNNQASNPKYQQNNQKINSPMNQQMNNQMINQVNNQMSQQIKNEPTNKSTNE